MSILEWSAAAFALAGAWLLGYRPALTRRVGWGCFLVSNILWICWGMSILAWPFVITQLFFIGTSVRGLILTAREKQ